MDEMNRIFGGQLRKELIELMRRSGAMRNRAHSTGSHRLSFDSTTEVGDNNLPISFEDPEY